VARQLWLLRHGEAVPHGAKPDSDRELTPRGERQGSTAGEALGKLGMEFDVCYTSPKVRARDTARLACEPLGLVAEEVSSIAAGFDLEDVADLFAEVDSDDARMLVVGHDPDFTQIVSDLTGARVDFKKGGVVGIRMEGSGRGELLAVLRPKELEALAIVGSEADS
jgi:phosphohistidine phosphatase